MPNATQAPPSQLEADMLKGFDTLTECPECQTGTYMLLVYREKGRIFVTCTICERSRDFINAHTPPRSARTDRELTTNRA